VFSGISELPISVSATAGGVGVASGERSSAAEGVGLLVIDDGLPDDGASDGLDMVGEVEAFGEGLGETDDGGFVAELVFPQLPRKRSRVRTATMWGISVRRLSLIPRFN